MHLIVEFAAGIVFVLSAGLIFNGRFRESYLAVACAGVIALASSYFAFEEMIHRVVSSTMQNAPHSEQPVKWNSKGTDSFSSADLATLKLMMDTNACRMGCANDTFDLLRIPIENAADGRRIYRVSYIKDGFCGSGGCMTAVMILDEGHLYIVREDLGLSDRQAMLIAREASSQKPK